MRAMRLATRVLACESPRMARFLLEPGEQVVHRQRLSVVGERGRIRAGELILTDRRIALESEKGDPDKGALFALLGMLGGLLRIAMTQFAVSHEILRADFAEIERTGKRTLRLRSK